MRKFLLCLLMSAALLCTGALAASDYFDATVTVQTEADGSVLITVEDSPVLSNKRPALRVKFGTSAETVSVLHGGRVESAALENGNATFTVSEGGTYRLAAGAYSAAVTVRPGCTADGEYTYSGAGASYTEAIPALGHDFGANGDRPACAVCGEPNPDYVPPAHWPVLPPETGAEEPPEEQPAPSAPAFGDVAEGDWYFEAVQYVAQNGLMEGVSSTRFDPEGQMTRAMFWAVLARIDGESVTGASWADDARAWATAAGVSDGTDPDGIITREQLVTMLYRYAGSPAAGGMAVSEFTDGTSVSDYAAGAMAWALSEGIPTGMGDGLLSPQGTATRAQAAAMLMRFDMM